MQKHLCHKERCEHGHFKEKPNEKPRKKLDKMSIRLVCNNYKKLSN